MNTLDLEQFYNASTMLWQEGRCLAFDLTEEFYWTWTQDRVELSRQCIARYIKLEISPTLLLGVLPVPVFCLLLLSSLPLRSWLSASNTCLGFFWPLKKIHMLLGFTDSDLLCVTFKLSYTMISLISLLPPLPHPTHRTQELCWLSGSLMEQNEYVVYCFLLKRKFS